MVIQNNQNVHYFQFNEIEMTQYCWEFISYILPGQDLWKRDQSHKEKTPLEEAER